MVILKINDVNGNAEYIRADQIVNLTETTWNDKPATLVSLDSINCGDRSFYTLETAQNVAVLWAASDKLDFDPNRGEHRMGACTIWTVDPENGYRRAI